MTYHDPTETPEPPKKPPAFCPMCRGELAMKWRGDHSCGMRAAPRAVPVFVCERCQLAVRVHRLPKKPLFSTRKAARADAASKYRRI